LLLANFHIFTFLNNYIPDSRPMLNQRGFIVVHFCGITLAYDVYKLNVI